MELEDRVIQQLHQSMDINAQTIEQFAPLITQASMQISHCLISEHKVLSVGNGPSGCLAQLFSALLINRFKHERPGLPVINLNSDSIAMSAIAEDSGFADIYSKQIRAYGMPGDILLAISADGRSANLVQAIQAAHDREVTVITLSGSDGGNMTALMRPDETEICIPSTDEALVHNAQLLVLHSLADLIDYQLFGA